MTEIETSAAGQMPAANADVRAATDHELLDALQANAAAKEGRITDHVLRREQPALHRALLLRFGSWNAALKRAGLMRLAPRHSDEECFDNLAALWRYHGRPPRYEELDKAPSAVGSAAYRRRCGNWRRALYAFAVFTGRDLDADAPPVPFVQPKRRAPGDSARKVPQSLRFQVLQRDRFTCTACGDSPALKPGCILHVDHIVPYSQGGRTAADNLRTLCAACNLGRGARP